MKTFFVLTTFSAALFAQAPNPASSGGPVVGFVNGPGALEITPVMGIASAAYLAAPVAAPEGAVKLYLPPRQQYALIEQQSGAPVGVWDLQKPGDSRTVRSIPGALPHAEIAVFSPKGSAAAVYSSSLGRLQILAGLPGMAAVKANISTEALGSVSNIAVSDDGAVAIAKNTSGQLNVWSSGQGWRLMPWNYSPVAWLFVSNSHDLVISDLHQSNLVLFQQVDGPNSPPVFLSSSGATPDLLAMTSDGENIIAADSAHRTMWSIEVKTGSVKAMSARQGQTSLLTLRDGHTFFLALEPDSSFSLLKVANAAAAPVILIHPGTTPAISQGAAQ